MLSDASDETLNRCAICLCGIDLTKLARTIPCRHEWDLPCILQWLEVSLDKSCPLCKTKVEKIEFEHSGDTSESVFISADEFQGDLLQTSPGRESPSRGPSHSRRRRHRSSGYSFDNQLVLMRRQYVYRNGLRACHIGTNKFTGFSIMSPSQFRVSSNNQSRARAFIRRELSVFPFLLSDYPDAVSASLKISVETDSCRRVCYMLQLIDIQSVRGSKLAREILSDYLGPANASIFCHELCAFLRSPCRTLAEYDRIVQYEIVDGLGDAASRRQKGEFGMPLCEISKKDIKHNLRTLGFDVLNEIPRTYSVMQQRQQRAREFFRSRKT
ncbi:uncharacterized protein V2V93DRAFT_378217 [Kockiozyma suomiensis]|uniref:uncharacterized protein n=1 Tax=Kockiozyma suomiensis TaxID=1337062 RepID=UPI003342FAA9